jgi:hypothetical protein
MYETILKHDLAFNSCFASKFRRNLVGNFLGTASNVLVEAHLDQFYTVTLAKFSFLLIPLKQQLKSGFAAKVFQRFKMLLPHVFNGDTRLRYMNIEMLRL